MNLNNELAEALAVTAEIAGTDLSAAAATMMALELAAYDRAQVLGALRKCRRELKGRLTMAAIIERLDDGRPGPEEAWSMIPTDDNGSVVWTDEMAAAYGVATPLLEAGDRIPARMAFREAYGRMVAEARDKRMPVRWTPSLGNNSSGRESVISEALRLGRLSPEQAVAIGIGYSGPASQDMMALVYGEAPLAGGLPVRAAS